MNQIISQTWKFLTHDIWHTSFEGMSRSRAIFIKNLRVLYLAVRGYLEDNIALRASALTFFSLLSVVPVLAMVFGIAKGFGVKEMLQNQLQESLEGHQEVFNYIVTFANSLLENTQGGWLAGIGILILIWSVVKVLWNIEISFNHIWQVKKERTPIRKLSDYLSIIILAPLFIILSGSINIFITTTLSNLTQEGAIYESIGTFIFFLLRFSSLLIIWVLLTLLYMVMPNTHVKFKSALFAAIIAGTLFQLVQWGYIHFQVGVSRYNAIYGSFAAFPLFLMFLQIAWMIVLFGAEFSFAHQNVTQYEYEEFTKKMSQHDRKLASLTVLHAIIKTFEEGKKPPTAIEISTNFKAPIKLVTQVIEDLLNSNLIREIVDKEESAYMPATDIHKMDVQFVLAALEDNGSGNIPIENKEPLTKFDEILDSFRKEEKKSGSNVLVKDVIR